MGYKKRKDGKTTLIVRDYQNLLNATDKEDIWKEYRKNGIEIKNDPISIYNSMVHATNVYNYYGAEEYSNKYTDAGKIGLVSTATTLAKTYVVSRALKAEGYVNEIEKKTEEQVFYENISERERKYFIYLSYKIII